jgi:carboxyl-terminal processing protease
MRASTGELFSEDSIHVIDSLVYFTPKKRKVFGGGGITPDVFIPLDTSMSDDHLSTLQQRALIKGFAFQVYGMQKDDLKRTYPTVESFLSDFRFSPLHASFKSYTAKRGVELEDTFIEAYSEVLERTVNTYIARFLFGYSAFHQALAHYDADVEAAKNEIERGTIKELGLK